MPPAARLPVDGDARLEEFEAAVGAGVAADLKPRRLEVDPGVDPKCRRKLAAGLDVDFAALLADGGVVEREVDPLPRAAFAKVEQGKLVIERVEADLGAGFDRE